MNGIVLLNKPTGVTSFKVLSALKHFYSTKKIGHCGTLDPFADGLLIACVNQATKIANFIENEEKEYIATLQLGVKTDTGDREGKIVLSACPPELTIDNITEALNSFVGQQNQIPPMHSALKYHGKKLYELARQGLEIERASRVINIKEIELLSWEKPNLCFRVVCSKGTYIRTLGEDIATELSSIGHLISLTRIRIGNFRLENAYLPQELNEKSLLSINQALINIPTYTVDEATMKKIRNGATLNPPYKDDIILFVDSKNEPLAIYKRHGDHYQCVRGLWE